MREIFYPPTLSAEQLDELQEDIRRADEGSMPNFDDEAVSTAVAELLRLRKSTEPRPMSEAPRVGEFWAIVPLTYDAPASEHMGSPVYRDRDSDQHMAESGQGWTYITGWLPASSGGEDSNNES